MTTSTSCFLLSSNVKVLPTHFFISRFAIISPWWILIIGSQDLIISAEKYLRSLDVRHRQVALTIKILDVNLESLSNCSLNKDLSVAKVVVSTNSSVLIEADLNNIHAFQIKEGVRPEFDGVPCYDIKTLLSIIPKVINEEKTPINVDFLNENLDKLEKILFNT